MYILEDVILVSIICYPTERNQEFYSHIYGEFLKVSDEVIILRFIHICMYALISKQYAKLCMFCTKTTFNL